MPTAHGQNATAANQAGNGMENVVVRSESLKRVLKLAEKVARHPAAVLIVGETGTGKEMIAHHIHNCSLRSHGPLIDVNCAAIPEHLVESELFGYEKGAFSGADSNKPGFFELADRGTLFLDEIGDLDMKVQVKLLRVLDGVPYFRLGGSKKVSVDARVVAATNRDLEDLVSQGRFREDLYHRLAQFKLDVPPLRDRPEDVLGIAEQVLHEHYPDSVFTQDAIDALLCYRWRGNVRELRNVVFRAVLQAENAQDQITADDLQIPGTEPREKSAPPASGDLDDMERQMIFQALEKHGGNQGKAADSLGISRRTLLRKLKLYREDEDKPAAGTLSVSQQKYYRADLELPVMMKYANEQFEGVLTNLSLGGAGVRTEHPLKFGAPVSLYFAIPGTNSAADILGRVAWTQKEGHHGIQFSDLPSSLRTTLQRWLQSEMKKDGWELADN
jgi:transcriptional regulator with PAS, ATPase and Fis domain